MLSVITISCTLVLSPVNRVAADGSAEDVIMRFNSLEKCLEYAPDMSDPVKTNNLYCDYNPNENALMLATAGSNDPQVTVRTGINADIYKYVIIIYRLPVSNQSDAGSVRHTSNYQQFFWKLNGVSYSEGRSDTAQLYKDYRYHSVVYDMSARSYWSGTLTSMRIDPFATGSIVWETMYIPAIAFSSTSSGASALASELENEANGSLNDLIGGISGNSNTTSTYLSTYNLDVWLDPVREGKIVYNESVFPMDNGDPAAIYDIPLTYEIDRIVSVRNGALNIEYKYGRDYRITDNGRLRIRTPAEGGTIPIVNFFVINQMNPNGDLMWWWTTNLSYRTLIIDATPFYHNNQISITYTHSDRWHGDSIVSETDEALSRAYSKLSNKQALTIVFNGDSITYGCNSSGRIYNIAPFTPRWSTMVTEGLKAKYGYNNITEVNTAVGGTKSDWGLANVNDNIIRYNPDLAVIAFGMNDFGIHTTQQFKNNINGMITAIRASCPNCEIILVSTIRPNNFITSMGNTLTRQDEYRDELYNLADQYEHVAVMDITVPHQYMLDRHTTSSRSASRAFLDFTGNNVNHNNDFMARFYAQTMIKLLSAPEEIIVPDEELEFSDISIDIDEDIQFDFRISNQIIDDTAVDSSKYSDIVFKYTMGSGSGTVTPVIDGTDHIYKVKVTSPELMAEVITVKLEAYYGNNSRYSRTFSYSVSQYCYGRLAESTDSAEKTLLVDLLNYGSAAQMYAGKNTNHLVNAGLTAEQRACATPDISYSTLVSCFAIDSDCAAPTAEWQNASLCLKDTVSLKFGYSGTANGVSSGTLSSEYVYYPILAENLDNEFTLYLTQSGNKTSNTLHYSIESYFRYVYDTFGENQNEYSNLFALIQSMMKYAASAAEYAAG